MAERCPEWWGPGLKWRIFHRCARPVKHTGRHRNEEGNLFWTGKMTEEEKALVPA